MVKKNEVQEVKNAIEAYNQINDYNYKSENDLLKVHQLMMKYFDEDNGNYRNHSDLNIIILSAIFHYYFVAIHPFSDENGRCVRFWVTLMLINYDKSFEFIPLEEEIYLNQERYYSSIDKLRKNNNFVLNDIQNKTLNINKTLTTKIKGEKWTISVPKTKNSIRLPITNLALNNSKMMYNDAKQYKDYSKDWFVFGKTRPFAETSIQKRKNNYCNLAGVKQIRIHDFRHSCASLLINQGASIAQVSKYLCHGNITITLNTYTHMTKILNNL